MRNKQRILLIEDDELWRINLSGVLEECGYAVEPATSWHSAIAQLKGADFYRIVSDLHVVSDAKDGIEMLVRIASLNPPRALVVSKFVGALKPKIMRQLPFVEYVLEKSKITETSDVWKKFLGYEGPQEISKLIVAKRWFDLSLPLRARESVELTGRPGTDVPTEGNLGVDRNVTPFDKLVVLCNRFHLVSRQLQRRQQGRVPMIINDEYDVQDVFHALLCSQFDDVRAEEYTPSYAGKSSRMDFLLKREQIVVEVKMAREGLTARELGSQLIDDAARYGSHAECKTLVCFVFDPNGMISNPRGVEADLTRDEAALRVRVFIRPS